MAIIINGINSGMVSLVDQHPVISLDLSTRQFTWPTDYKVVAIMGDANSQKLTFEVPAIYEGIDLTDTTCVLTYWTSWTNDEGKHSTGTVNLELTELENAKEGYLYYTWTLDQNQTANSGEVKFKIGFYLVLDTFDPSGYENLSYIITDGHLAIYNNLELILTTDNYYALSSNSGTFNIIPDGISKQTKIRLVDWATRAEQAANEATGAANNANIQAERTKEAADNAITATEMTEQATNNAITATENAITATENAITATENANSIVNNIPGIVETPMVDYIVEQGTSGIWTYRKWTSGMAEMWGTAELKNKTQSPGQLLCFDMNLPWTQVEGKYPAGIVTPRNLEENYILRSSTIHYFTWYSHNENRIRFGAIADDKNWEAGTEASVSIIVKGRWK